jgi:uncharacterized protein YoxC
MTTWNAVWGVLLQVQAMDTVLVQQVEPSLFHRIAAVAGGLVNILLLFIVIALIPLLVVVMKLVRRLTRLMEHVQGEVRPIAQHAAAIADNVNYISTAVRADVQRVSDTVTAANRRVNEVIDTAEDRVRELQAVIDVVQEEAQETMISAAAAMRGMRAGAAAFRDQLTDDAFELDAADAAEEMGELHDERAGREYRPRIRRRGGRHGQA